MRKTRKLVFFFTETNYNVPYTSLSDAFISMLNWFPSDPPVSLPPELAYLLRLAITSNFNNIF